MKIIRLEASNVKRLIAVDITPGDRPVVRISGPNGSGKSSLLDSILMAFAGERAIPSEPIRKGANQADIEIDVGDLVVRRRFTKRGTRLEVTNREGAPQKSPQAMLDALVGGLAFDPLEFTRKKPREQLEALAATTDLGLDRNALVDIAGSSGVDLKLGGSDLEVLTAFEAGLAEARKLARAAAERAHVAAQDAAKDAPAAEVKPVVLAELMERRKAREAEREAWHVATRAATAAQDRATAAERQVKAIEAKITELQAQHADAKRDLVAALEATEKAKADMRPGPPDFADLDAAAADAERTNQQAARWARVVEKRAASKVAADAEEKAQAALDAFRAFKAETMAAASFPVPELAFGDNEVLYRGLPLDQASDAERLRVAVAIAMAGNPKLRVIRIRDGSLLDSAGMKLLEELAREREFQCWVEQVAVGPGAGFYLEDGGVAAIDGVPQP
jgi:ABC-type dipeptide/oligopeptide/nickel transport system ATPase component